MSAAPTGNALRVPGFRRDWYIKPFVVTISGGKRLSSYEYRAISRNGSSILAEQSHGNHRERD